MQITLKASGSPAIVIKTPNNVAKNVRRRRETRVQHIKNLAAFDDVVFSITSSPHLVPFCQTLSHI